jgi:hypothetical protein
MGAKFRQAPAVVKRAMREAAEAVKADAEKSTATWKHKVTFAITAAGTGYTIATNDKIYGFVDEGTKPHVIVPRHGRVLRFATGGQPKTTPGRITAGGGSKGSNVVFTPRVNHPGTKARLFTKQLAQRWQRGTAPFIRHALEAHFR